MSLFFRNQFFIALFVLAAVSVVGVWITPLYYLAIAGVIALAVATLFDAVMLWFCKVSGERIIAEKLDLGENNRVGISMKVVRGNLRGCYALDEMPQFLRCKAENLKMKKDEDGVYVAQYTVFPLRRGAFELGRLLVFGRFIGILERRFVIEQKGNRVDVYPAFSRLREKEQQVRSMQVEAYGTHRRQTPANQTDFMDIREYVPGDDIRTINWKATARAGRTMVNNYEDERSQHIYNIIDCGRSMHRTFGGLTLQDYAINASLLLSYTALHSEGDNVGFFSYGPKGVEYLPSRSGDVQLNNIMKHLYGMETEYGEGDLEELTLVLGRKVQRRSLVCLYTDYSSMKAMDRQIDFLKRISRRHCLVVVMFIDKELENLSEGVYEASGAISVTKSVSVTAKPSSSDYIKRSLAKDFSLQKQFIVDRLQQNGIQCVLTYPESLSINVVRKYIDLKAKRAW